MSHTYPLGALVKIKSGITPLVAKILERDIACKVMISDGYSRCPGFMPFGRDSGPVYRLGFCPIHSDDDEDGDYEWIDWFREKEIAPLDLLDHMADELRKADLLNYVTGDATQPQGEGLKFIVHICNDAGLWGRGFVLALSRRWSEPESAYREWHARREGFGLGNIQPIKVDDNTIVINMVAQHGVIGRQIGRDPGPPIRYCELKQCLRRVTELAKAMDASVHMPRIGAGLAGGDWDVIEDIIKETLVEGGIVTTVYDFSG